MDGIDVALFDEVELCPQLMEAEEVGVEPSAANLVATRLGDDSPAKARQQRADHQHRTAQGGAFADKLVALQIVQPHIVGLESIVVGCEFLHLHAYLA